MSGLRRNGDVEQFGAGGLDVVAIPCPHLKKRSILARPRVGIDADAPWMLPDEVPAGP
jgi:hypothetical protein